MEVKSGYGEKREGGETQKKNVIFLRFFEKKSGFGPTKSGYGATKSGTAASN